MPEASTIHIILTLKFQNMLLDSPSWKGLDGHLVGLKFCLACCTTGFQFPCKILVTLVGCTLDHDQAKAKYASPASGGTLIALDQFRHAFIYSHS